MSRYITITALALWTVTTGSAIAQSKQTPSHETGASTPVPSAATKATKRTFTKHVSADRPNRQSHVAPVAGANDKKK